MHAHSQLNLICKEPCECSRADSERSEEILDDYCVLCNGIWSRVQRYVSRHVLVYQTEMDVGCYGCYGVACYGCYGCSSLSDCLAAVSLSVCLAATCGVWRSSPGHAATLARNAFA